MERWLIKNKKADLKSMANQLKVSEVICKLLVNRDIVNIEEAERFIRPQINSLYDARILKDVEKAVEIMKAKIDEGKRIRIIGDYDVDGVISTFILYTALQRCGAEVDYTIPDRIIDGYGININLIDQAIEAGVDTIITCDNGISAVSQIQYAKNKGLTVIVTDHHDIPFEEIEGEKRYIEVAADAVINPKQNDCNYPFKKICGAGVVFKFSQVLYEEMKIDKKETYDFIQFAAIATVCDVVDLIDENRIMVKYGLEAINHTENQGLKQLIKHAGLEGKKITTYSLGFVLGPCINATGRLDSAYKGVELLAARESEQIEKLAKELVELNKQRKEMTIRGLEKIVDKIEGSEIKRDKVFVVYDDTIHESIAGIIAGRVKDKYNVPTVILTKAEEGVKGSARSIEEYNMFEELSKCKELLTKFGGHPLAAGLSLEEKNIELLRKKLNTVTTLTEEDLIPKTYIDMQLPIEKISLPFIEELGILEPFGKGNGKPLFGEKNLMIRSLRVLGKEKNVLKLKLVKGKVAMDSVYFGDVVEFENSVREKYGEEEYNKLLEGNLNNVKIDVLFYPDINEYLGNKYLQVVIQKYRV